MLQLVSRTQPTRLAALLLQRPSVAVARRHVLYVLNAPLANEVRRKEIGELTHSLGFATGSQQQLPEIEIRHRLRQTEAELRFLRLFWVQRLVGGERLPFVVNLNGPLLDLGLRRHCVVVVPD